MGLSSWGPRWKRKVAHLISVYPARSHPTAFLDLSINTAVCGTLVINRATSQVTLDKAQIYEPACPWIDSYIYIYMFIYILYKHIVCMHLNKYVITIRSSKDIFMHHDSAWNEYSPVFVMKIHKNKTNHTVCGLHMRCCLSWPQPM